MEIKTCNSCHKDKPLDQFNWKKKSENKRSGNCRECQKEYKRDHYVNNKEYYYDRNVAKRKETKKLYEEYKATLSCEECCEDHPWCIEFHHKNGDKEFNIAQAVYQKSFKQILQEIKKCKVLCANCHRKEHYKLRNTAHSSNG